MSTEEDKTTTFVKVPYDYSVSGNAIKFTCESSYSAEYDYDGATNKSDDKHYASVTTGTGDDGETKKYYTTLAKAVEAADAGSTVTVLQDIKDNNALTETVVIDKTVTLDLNGKNITISSDATSVYDAIAISETGNLTITDTSTGTTKGSIAAGTDDAIWVKANGTLTIENGTINAGTNNYAVYNSGSVTMKGGTISASAGYGVSNVGGKDNTSASFTMTGGTITAKANGVEVIARQGVTLSETNTPAAQATITGGTITAASGGCGVLLYGNGTTNSASLVVGSTDSTSSTTHSITVGGNGFAVSGNGTKNSTNNYGGTSITINSGTLTAHTTNLTESNIGEASVAIYHPQDGTLIINGGTIDGDTGVEIRSGTLSVTGGVIKGYESLYSSKANGNGNTSVGAGIAIAQHTTAQAINATIGGGTISGQVGVSVTNPNQIGTTSGETTVGDIKLDVTNGTIKGTAASLFYQDTRSTVGLSGGTFEGSVVNAYTADSTSGTNTITVDGTSATKADISNLTVTSTGNTKFKEANDVPEGYVAKEMQVDGITYYQITPVAKIGEKEYYRLTDAINAVAENETVVLLADVKDVVSINSANAFTLDINGKTVSGAITVNSNANVTLKDDTSTNGSITAAINNQGTLTLGGVNVNVSGNAVTNSGTLTVNNGTNTVTGNILLSGASAKLTLTRVCW